MAVSRTMDELLKFAGSYQPTKDANGNDVISWVSDWGSDAEINKLLTKIKDKGDVTSADLTQMIALTGQANIQSQFVSSVIQEYTSLMKALLQKMS